jgi:hypothetical protein
LSKTLVDSVQQLFRPQQPLWACEFTNRHIVVAGVDNRRTRIQGRLATAVPEGINLNTHEDLRNLVHESLSNASFKGAEIALIIPDESARITFLTTDTLPKTLEEQQTFLRWKLKKTVPFDVDHAQIAFRVLGNHKASGCDVVVALSPRSIIESYELLMDDLGIHAGFVIPSTLAALNLLEIPAEDTLFVKIAPDCVTTTVFMDKRMKFYRRVAELGPYESVYPTVLYYQDKLGGTTFGGMIVCGYEHEGKAAMEELQERLGIPARPLEPRNQDDIFKPALGAVHLSWATLI